MPDRSELHVQKPAIARARSLGHMRPNYRIARSGPQQSFFRRPSEQARDCAACLLCGGGAVLTTDRAKPSCNIRMGNFSGAGGMQRAKVVAEQIKPGRIVGRRPQL